MALFQKENAPGKEGVEETEYPSCGLPFEKACDKNEQKIITEFWNQTFTEDINRMYDAKRCGFLKFGDQLYLAPPQCPSLKGLKVMRAGLHLGEMKKDRFEPAHALALASDRTKVKKQYALSEKDAYAYQRGEGKSGLSLEKTDLGWTILTFRGFPLGWGKASGSQIKNHCPKGLRRS